MMAHAYTVTLYAKHIIQVDAETTQDAKEFALEMAREKMGDARVLDLHVKIQGVAKGRGFVVQEHERTMMKPVPPDRDWGGVTS